MDDLSKKLDALLNSPDGMQKIQQMMEALGGTEAPPPKTPNPDMPELDSILRLMPLLTQLGQEDENTALLKALRPYLHGGREKRLEESMRMMKLLKFLPLLQQKGG
jgi:hypothetical protein